MLLRGLVRPLSVLYAVLLILLAVLLVPGAAGLTGVMLWGMRRNR